jgi:hypothetical protein
MRDYLVFVRAGPSSLHPKLLAQDPRRNWDCCVSWHTQPVSLDGDSAEFHETGGDNKFEAFVAFFRKTAASHPYRYYLVVDDDIDFAPGDVSRLFTLCSQHATFVCQPALRWGTHISHDVTLWNPVCVVRKTTFVEVMSPCFSRQAVEQLERTFLLTKSTWGIDYVWGSLLAGQNRLAVVDAVRVAHTKPLGFGRGDFYEKLKRLGVDAWEEYTAIMQRYPSFGGLRTLPRGHVFARRLPAWLGRRIATFFEWAKGPAHRLLNSAGKARRG